jgi:hypothetical protein
VSEEKKSAPPPDKAAELQREILAGREFSLSEAVARMAGRGLTKGASPITRERQAETLIEEYLLHNLKDGGSTLGTVLLRRVGQSELLLKHLDQPLAALSHYVQHVLGAEYLLANLVEEADVERGRMFGERPHFEKPGCRADADDPYTIASVRNTLSQLLVTLASDSAAPSS